MSPRAQCKGPDSHLVIACDERERDRYPHPLTITVVEAASP